MNQIFVATQIFAYDILGHYLYWKGEHDHKALET